MILEHTSPLWGERQDSHVENYITVEYCRKVPLIVDPQGESLKGLQRLCGPSLVQVDMFSSTLQGIIVATVGMGHPMLIDNVSEPIPLLLAQLISPKIMTQSNSLYIQLGSKVWHYSPDFKLYLRTERSTDQFSKEFTQKVCLVNIALGTRVIQDNLMEVFLGVNAIQLTSKRDELIEDKAKTIKQIDQLEQSILEVLSKSGAADLENDKAVEMLSEVGDLSVKLQDEDVELVRIGEQLRHLKHRFFRVAEYGARLINVALSLARLSPFYARTIRYYFNIFTEAVAVDMANLNEEAIEEINQTVLKAFLKRTSKFLFGEHRKMFEFLACNEFTYKSFSAISERKFASLYSKHITITQTDLNLRQQIFNMDSRVPLIILLSSRSNYVIRMLYSLAEQMPKLKNTVGQPGSAAALSTDNEGGNRKIQVIPVDGIREVDYERCLTEDQWLIVQNCQLLNGDEINSLEKLIEKIAESTIRKVSFRMFIIMYPENGEAPHSLLDKCNVLTVDEEFTLKAFLFIATPLCLLQNYMKPLIIPIKEIFSTASAITIGQFESAVSLLKDLSATRAKISFDTVLKNVLEVAYLGDISMEQDIKIFSTIALWIFQGLNPTDNALIEGICPKYSMPAMAESVRELILAHIKIAKLYYTIRVLLADSSVVEPRKKQGYKERAETDSNIVKKTVKSEEDYKFVDPMPTLGPVSDESGVAQSQLANRFHYCIQIELRILEEMQLHTESESYLKGLFRSQKIERIILAYLHRPKAIFEVIKLEYAKKQNIPYDQVECHGTLKCPGLGVESIELAECYLLAADFDKEYGCLQEPQDQKPFTLLDTVWVVVQQKVEPEKLPNRRKTLPLFHKFAQQENFDKLKEESGLMPTVAPKYLPILEIEVDTNLPEAHWLLRGAKFTTLCRLSIKF
uniref:Dynein heavy chain ATP-binding dynein motor region domain-containing protein n=1 Tax=Ditylenchus dipsaci TaxID=166011 RepID=A0A915EHB8_9BILA